jgi:hypothetical protein
LKRGCAEANDSLTTNEMKKTCESVIPPLPRYYKKQNIRFWSEMGAWEGIEE